MEDALNKLAQYFPSMDRNFLEDVYVSSKKDFDKTVDELLGMGVEMTVDKKDQQKPVPVQQPQKPTYTPSPAVTSPPPPTNPHYYHHTPSNLPPPLTPTPSSPQVPHHLQQQQQQQPPINMNPPSSIPTTTSPPSLINSGYQPRMDPYSIPATPPPIMNSLNPSSLNPPSTAPTAPLALMKSDSQSDQKRYETLKQDLSLEYQRISEQHKYNLELQQKLDQLSEFTSSEQKKLEEQRLAFNEEKRRFSEELTNRFKALQEDYGRQKAELVAQEERRVAEAEALAEAKRQAKEERRVIKTQQKEEEIALRQATESAMRQEINDLSERLAEALANGKELQQCNDELAEFKYEAEQQINSLQETNKNLTKQLRNTEYEASAEVLSYFSSVVSTLADGIHSVSLERANKRSDESEGENEGERENPLQDLKRTFFKTIHESFNNKLRESDH